MDGAVDGASGAAGGEEGAEGGGHGGGSSAASPSTVLKQLPPLTRQLSSLTSICGSVTTATTGPPSTATHSVAATLPDLPNAARDAAGGLSPTKQPSMLISMLQAGLPGGMPQPPPTEGSTSLSPRGKGANAANAALASKQRADHAGALAAAEALHTRVQGAVGAGALEAIATALKHHAADPTIVQPGLEALAGLCVGIGSPPPAAPAPTNPRMAQAAAMAEPKEKRDQYSCTIARRVRAFEAGAIGAASNALRAFIGIPAVLHAAAAVVEGLATGTATGTATGEEEGLATHRAACMEAAVIEGLALTLLAHPSNAPLQEQAYRALSGVLGGGGPDGRTSKLRAMDAGLLDAVQASLASFPAEAPSHVEAVRTLTTVVSGLDSMGKQRQARCAEAGAIEAIVSSLTVKAGPGGGAPRWAMAARYRALRNLTRNSDELTQRALDAGAQPDWVVAIKKKD